MSMKSIRRELKKTMSKQPPSPKHILFGKRNQGNEDCGYASDDAVLSGRKKKRTFKKACTMGSNTRQERGYMSDDSILEGGRVSEPSEDLGIVKDRAGSATDSEPSPKLSHVSQQEDEVWKKRQSRLMEIEDLTKYQVVDRNHRSSAKPRQRQGSGGSPKRKKTAEKLSFKSKSLSLSHLAIQDEEDAQWLSKMYRASSEDRCLGSQSDDEAEDDIFSDMILGSSKARWRKEAEEFRRKNSSCSALPREGRTDQENDPFAAPPLPPKISSRSDSFFRSSRMRGLSDDLENDVFGLPPIPPKSSNNSRSSMHSSSIYEERLESVLDDSDSDVVGQLLCSSSRPNSGSLENLFTPDLQSSATQTDLDDSIEICTTLGGRSVSLPSLNPPESPYSSQILVLPREQIPTYATCNATPTAKSAKLAKSCIAIEVVKTIPVSCDENLEGGSREGTFKTEAYIEIVKEPSMDDSHNPDTQDNTEDTELSNSQYEVPPDQQQGGIETQALEDGLNPPGNDIGQSDTLEKMSVPPISAAQCGLVTLSNDLVNSDGAPAAIPTEMDVLTVPQVGMSYKESVDIVLFQERYVTEPVDCLERVDEEEQSVAKVQTESSQGQEGDEEKAGDVSRILPSKSDQGGRHEPQSLEMSPVENEAGRAIGLPEQMPSVLDGNRPPTVGQGIFELVDSIKECVPTGDDSITKANRFKEAVVEEKPKHLDQHDKISQVCKSGNLSRLITMFEDKTSDSNKKTRSFQTKTTASKTPRFLQRLAPARSTPMLSSPQTSSLGCSTKRGKDLSQTTTDHETSHNQSNTDVSEQREPSNIVHESKFRMELSKKDALEASGGNTSQSAVKIRIKESMAKKAKSRGKGHEDIEHPLRVAKSLEVIGSAQI